MVFANGIEFLFGAVVSSSRGFELRQLLVDHLAEQFLLISDTTQAVVQSGGMLAADDVLVELLLYLTKGCCGSLQFGTIFWKDFLSIGLLTIIGHLAQVD